MKITCLEHSEIYQLGKNYEILIHGNVCGYGAEICWCMAVNATKWFELLQKVIENEPLYEFPNESFGGRTSDTCFVS